MDEIGVIAEFLGADAEKRETLAPELVEAVGAAQLTAVLDATWNRIGPFTTVTEGPAGLTAHGTRGRAPLFALVGADGRLRALYLGGRSPSAAATLLRRALPPGAAPLLGPLALAGTGVALWTAGSAADWLASAAVAALLLVLALGFGAPSVTDYPRPARWALAAAVLGCALSAVRLGGRPAGTPGPGTYAAWAVVVLLAALVTHSRLASVRAAVSSPLRLPVDAGTWYVGQGGGRWLNHHHAVPEQRGAVDLVKLRPDGTRAPGFGARRDPAAYAAYGTPLRAPCSGTVVRAVDGLADQVPGRARFGPPAGNHVAIDTGRERVLLAHLRPGSVRVRAGDRVRTGDLLGEVGNSGNTSEPHLHLQADRDGLGLRLRFEGVQGRFWRGRRLRVPDTGLEP